LKYKIIVSDTHFVVFLSGTQLGLDISTSIVCDACTPMSHGGIVWD